MFLVVGGLYSASVRCRLDVFSGFLSSFISDGAPLVFSIAVCWVEVVRYVLRPGVLMFRPIANLGFGANLVDFYLSVICYWLYWCYFMPVSDWYVYFGVAVFYFYE